MFHYIKGNVTMKFDGGVVVEAGGIGYEVFVPDNSPLYLADGKETVLVYTVMIVREDDVSLYGFHDREALDLFRKLMTVSGVGAKAALAILSSMPVGEIKKAIVFDDAAALTKANGIGKKIAQRITLELKEKLGAVGGLAEAAEKAVSDSGKSEAVNGLISLGYSRSEAMGMLAGITDDGLTAEEYIKRALKGIGRK
ncbi:MAG TPA: Holliday junction branch migration protein RuvA [Anaerovoracaceae bacterium]|nr:Holliday junction branch migration protein RuvA [Anaerovoracaceae bacterium]